MFSIGDRVRILNDNARGIVKSISGDNYSVELEDGFEEIFEERELIKDEKLNVKRVFSKDASLSLKTKSKSSKPEILEVDLHFAHLVDRPKEYTAHEKLTIQMDHIHKSLNHARIDKIEKLILIHGKGNGRLEGELLDILRKEKNLEFFDADFKRYKGGATEVRLRF